MKLSHALFSRLSNLFCKKEGHGRSLQLSVFSLICRLSMLTCLDIFHLIRVNWHVGWAYGPSHLFEAFRHVYAHARDCSWHNRKGNGSRRVAKFILKAAISRKESTPLFDPRQSRLSYNSTSGRILYRCWLCKIL